jgi:enolase-phosphatase E1
LTYSRRWTRSVFATASLTALSGKLWKTGYDNGELKTPLFEDVIPTLEAWKNAGKSLVVYSSGSIAAQLQFFSVVQDGEKIRDLKPLFAAHFDPTIAGSKLEKGSYEKICAELGREATQVTFLTDNVKGT